MGARIGVPSNPDGVGSAKRIWQRGIVRSEATFPTNCRVCGLPLQHRIIENGNLVEHGETTWFMAWSVDGHAHEACGYFSLSDREAVEITKAIVAWWETKAPCPGDRVILRAHEMGLLLIESAPGQRRGKTKPTIHLAKLRALIAASEPKAEVG